MNQKTVDILDYVMDYLYDRESGEEKIVCIWKDRKDSVEMMNLIKGQTEWEQKGVSSFETGNGSIITTTTASPHGMAEAEKGVNYSVGFVHSSEEFDIRVLLAIKPFVHTFVTVSGGGAERGNGVGPRGAFSGDATPNNSDATPIEQEEKKKSGKEKT